MAAGGSEDAGHRGCVDVLPGCAEARRDVLAKELGRNDTQLKLLRAPPERLVGVVEDALHHVALAAEVQVRDFRLLLEDRAHELRQVGVDVDDLLELVEDHAHPPVPVGPELAGELEEALERRVDVVGPLAGLEPERERAVGRVEGDSGRDSEPAEDARRLLAGAVDDGRDVLVDRLRELLGELLLGRRRHQVDLGDEHAVRDQPLADPPDERGLSVAPRGEDHDVLSALSVRHQLGDLACAIGERVVERECPVAKRVACLLLHTYRYYTFSYVCTMALPEGRPGLILLGIILLGMKRAGGCCGSRPPRQRSRPAVSARCSRARAESPAVAPAG